MIQSLPNIVKVFTISCASLAPNVVEKYMAGIPVGVYPLPKEVEQYGTGQWKLPKNLAKAPITRRLCSSSQQRRK